MKKYWLIKEKANYLIAISKGSLYTGSAKKYDELKLINDLEKDIVPSEIFSIPFSYIKTIENPQEKNKITINYGNDSIEELIINDKIIKREVFSVMKSEMDKFDYSESIPTVLRHAKAQIIAMLILTGLFIWTFYIANEMSKGFEYELVGNKGPGLAGIVLILAHFGTLKVTIGYLLLISLAGFSLFKKAKNRTLTEYLIRKN